MSSTFRVMFFMLGSTSLVAQVSNNNIKNRTELIMNAPAIHSTTDYASVEWSCISKALTQKCLVYHNDQWFHFTPDRSGKFFLNVSAQQCRDGRGIQVIVIEGNPCEISTYKILQCIPKVNQDDVFIELDSLKAGVQYLVNIDGFLGDFCGFDIQFSDLPRGLPRITHNLDSLNLTAYLKDSVVSLRWAIHESIAANTQSFSIYRTEKEEKKSVLLGALPLRANALGAYEREYTFRDSLVKPGAYTYRIFGIQKETDYPLLLDEHQVSFYSRGSHAASAGPTWVYLPMKLKQGERYMVLIFNKVDYALLRKYTGEFDASKDATFEINLRDFVNSGIKEFIILASEAESKQAKEFYFLYDGSKIIKQ